MSRKRLLTLVGVLILALILVAVPILASCNGGDDGNGNGGNGDTGNGTPPPPPPPAERPEIRIVYAGHGSASSDSAVEQYRFFQMWDEVTPNHDIVWEPHWGDEIFPADQNVEAVASGAVQMGGTLGYRAESFEPLSQIFTIPLLWRSHDHIVRFFWSPECQARLAQHEQDGVKVAYFTTYTMWLAFSDRAVTQLEDIEGSRIRTMASPIMTRAIELLGANPVSVVMAELTVAMQTGMFEGMIVSLSPGYMRMLGYLDYMNYVVEFPITYTIAATAFNAPWYNGLDDEVKLAYEAIHPDWFANLMNITLQSQIDGKTIWRTEATPTSLTQAEMDRWTAQMQPILDEVDARLGGGLMDAALATQYGDPQGQFGGLVIGWPLEDRYNAGYIMIPTPR